MKYKALETDRLLLKNISMEDRDFVLSQFSNEDINRYLFDAEPISRLEEADEIIGFYLQPEPRGHHRWVLVSKTDGEKMGTCGFHGYNPKEGSIEMGYDLGKEFWGKGYMTEALEAIIAYAEEILGIQKIRACIYVDNEKSIKLVQKLGFVYTGTTKETFRGKEYLHNVYAIEDKPLKDIHYRELTKEEINLALFKDFSRHQRVEKCWRKDKGEWVLKDITFTEYWSTEDYKELIQYLQKTLETGGAVYGAFSQERLIGFASVENELFGPKKEYLQLSCIHISFESRGKGIGKKLFNLVCEKAKALGGKKLYISAHSSEESIAFYHRLGCVEAKKYNEKLVAEEPCDCQLEYPLGDQ